MKKQYMIVVGIISIIGLSSIYLLSQKPDESLDSTIQTSDAPSISSNTAESTPAPVANTEQAATQSSVAPKPTPTPGAYVAYSSDKVSSTSGTKLLFFHAPWCSQCRSIESGIVSEGVPSGVTIFKVDYDSNQKLRQQYGVTLQTTFVKVDDSGKVIEKHVAYNEPTFAAVKKAIL